MKKYRPNVCAVLTDDATTHVLVFRRVERADYPQYWQFPQGGLDAGETPEQGLLRELEEEVGTRDVEVLRRAVHPVRYDFPPDVLELLARGDPEKRGYDGQEQHWFLARLRGGTADIHFLHQPAEFDAFRWVTPDEALAQVVSFKQEAYRLGLQALGMLPEREG